jgi:hypothetical protein
MSSWSWSDQVPPFAVSAILTGRAAPSMAAARSAAEYGASVAPACAEPIDGEHAATAAHSQANAK